MKELNEKVVVISGCGQGIGKGVALHLARRGMKVVGMGRRLAPVEATIAEIKAAGGEGLALAGDVGKREDVDAVIAACVKAYGTVDVVINNAQSLPGSAAVEDWATTGDVTAPVSAMARARVSGCFIGCFLPGLSLLGYPARPQRLP